MAVTLDADQELLHFSFPIQKQEDTGPVNPVDGTPDIWITGKATDGTVDADRQIVDPEWSAVALKEWAATGGNVRMAHDPRRPVGKGHDVQVTMDGHYVRSLISDPLAKHFIRTGVLNDYSVGISMPHIKHGPHKGLDPRGEATGGIITGRPDGLSKIAELSVVDRGSNFHSQFQITKSDGGFTGMMAGDSEEIAAAVPADLLAKVSGGTDDRVTKDVIQVQGGITSDDEVRERLDLPPWAQGLVPVAAELIKSAQREPDMSITFTPDDLMKIMQHKIVEQHYDELAVKAVTDAEAAVYKRDIDTATRRHLAGQGHALADGSYPIANAEDLHNAAILARSGHGNAEAAKRLIARRARELDVPNPLNDSGESPEKEGTSVTTPAIPDVVKDDMATEAAEPEVIKGPDEAVKAKKPKKGKKMPPWMADGKGNDDDDDDGASCKMDHVHTGKCHQDPKSASGAADAADMNPIPHPDALQESPMPAGRRTADTKGEGSNPEAAALLRFKTIGLDADLGKLHDLTCPAYDPEDVAKYHPYASFADIDTDVWMRKALDAACGPLEHAYSAARAWEAAQLLKQGDPAELNEYRLESHKAFRDANPGPSSYPSPGSMTPGRFARPVITGGHAANSPGYGAPNSSPDVASGPPNAMHFDRPPLSAGHQSPSPSHMKADWEYPAQQGVPTHINYGYLEKERTRAALSMMHDHLAHQFPMSCPMLAQDAYRQPEERALPVTEGVGKSDVPDVTEPEMVIKARKKMRRKLGKKVLAGTMTVDEARSRIGRDIAQKTGEAAVAGSAEPAVVKGVTGTVLTQVPAISPELVKSAVAEAIAPLMERITAQKARLDEQQKVLEAIADRPDPMTAAFTGLALNPVTKNVRPVAETAEIAERTQQMIKRRLQHEWRSSENPAEREAAWAELAKYQS